ncbi:MAG: DUF1330 domain-containing protein [Flavobacteriales bacterium]
MPAYIFVDIDITDPATYEEYKKLTPATLAAHKGRFIVRGGPVEVLEGDRKPGRIVVMEFPDMSTAKGWWASDEYAPAKAIRQRASHAWMVAMEGVA